MKKRYVKSTVATLAAVLVAIGMTACSASDKSNDASSAGTSSGEGEAPESVTVVIAGSTSVQPLSEMLAEAYMDDHPEVGIEVQGGGSGQGIKAVEEKIADFGALSRELKSEEEVVAAEQFLIAKDGIAVVVNNATELSDITVEQLKRIYTGEVANWSEVGGGDAKINVITREEGSGTRSAFGELTGVLGKDENGEERDFTIDSAIVQNSTGAVLQTVAATPDSIGFVSLGSVDDSVKVLEVEGVKASKETVVSGEYKISRPFLYICGPNLGDGARSFAEFILSGEGQAIVEDAGFIAAA
ncbi:MAG: phosphate ABC transporter substrate-binding protein [Clostridiales Family XIII bacterium]|nr:phosphate ABC transporter substrate-binding protein [Clostridiales Family XIII bacterium]